VPDYEKILEHRANKALRAAGYGDIKAMERWLEEITEIVQKENNRKKSLEMRFKTLRKINAIFDFAEEILRIKAEKATDNFHLHRYFFFEIERLLKEKEKMTEKLFPQVSLK